MNSFMREKPILHSLVPLQSVPHLITFNVQRTDTFVAELWFL